MNGIDIAVLIAAVVLLGGILLYFRILKKKGKSIHCNCGKKHLSGKALVEEYHETYCCCDKKKD